jgi:hypothetical protein
METVLNMNGIMAFLLRYLTISPTITAVSILLISLPVFVYTLVKALAGQASKK